MRDPLGAATLQRMIRERDAALAQLHGARGLLAQRDAQLGDVIRYLAALVRMIVTASEAKRLATPEESRTEKEPIQGIRLAFEKLDEEGPEPVLYFRRMDEVGHVFIRLTPFPGGPPTADTPPPPVPSRKIVLLGDGH